jgi:hypothetical protein
MTVKLQELVDLPFLPSSVYERLGGDLQPDFANARQGPPSSPLFPVNCLI